MCLERDRRQTSKSISFVRHHCVSPWREKKECAPEARFLLGQPDRREETICTQIGGVSQAEERNDRCCSSFGNLRETARQTLAGYGLTAAAVRTRQVVVLIVGAHRQTIEVIRPMIRFIVMMLSIENAVVIVIFLEDAPSIFFFHACRLRIEFLEDQMKIVRPEEFDQQRFDDNVDESTIQRLVLQQFKQTQQTTTRRFTTNDMP